MMQRICVLEYSEYVHSRARCCTVLSLYFCCSLPMQDLSMRELTFLTTVSLKFLSSCDHKLAVLHHSPSVGKQHSASETFLYNYKQLSVHLLKDHHLSMALWSIILYLPYCWLHYGPLHLAVLITILLIKIVYSLLFTQYIICTSTHSIHSMTHSPYTLPSLPVHSPVQYSYSVPCTSHHWSKGILIKGYYKSQKDRVGQQWSLHRTENGHSVFPILFDYDRCIARIWA